MMLQMVDPAQITSAWPLLRGYIKAASRGIESISDIRRKLFSGETRAVQITHDGKLCGAMVLERLPNSLHITSLGGDLPKGWQHEAQYWLQLRARMLDAPALSLKGRKGWIRLLSPLGWVYDESTGFMECRT